jgi:hypothetical protein
MRNAGKIRQGRVKGKRKEDKHQAPNTKLQRNLKLQTKVRIEKRQNH